MNRNNRIKKRNKGAETSPVMIRENTSILYGIYFATSNTDFLLTEQKTRFSIRPNVVLKSDRKTVVFDYSNIGTEKNIFDGFFRGISAGTTLGLGGGIVSTCNYINEINGTSLTDFADTYTISTIDVDSKIIIGEKESAISSTTAVSFEGNYFIDLPQWTKTQSNQTSTPIKKIINILPNQALSKIGVRIGSVLEFKKTTSNNNKFTVVDIQNENGFEVIKVEEPITQEDASSNQIIISVYGKLSEQPNIIETGPFSVQGYYPLYTTIAGAVAASPDPTSIRDGETTVGYHTHILNGTKYYMPNGLGGPGSGSQFHGDYEVEVEVEVSTPLVQRRTNTTRSVVRTASSTSTTPSTPYVPPSAPSTPSAPTAPSTPYVPPSAPSTPYVPPSSPSPPSSGGGGYGGGGY